MKTATKKEKTILYFGIFDPDFSRNKIYIEGLRRNGIAVVVCADRSKGLRKFWNLFRLHRKLRGTYDLLIVGYTGYLAVPLARLIATAPVAFDALCSFYEAEIVSRDAFRGNPLRIPYVRLVDWLSTRCAAYVFVETERQKNYFIHELGIRPDKLMVVYTGADDEVFRPDAGTKKQGRFTVLFRGRINREAGAAAVIAAAKALSAEPAGAEVDFLVIGYGWDDAARAFDAALAEVAPKNLRHIGRQLPTEELCGLMLSCHASLGQLSDNERLSRTVPHKAYESLAMGLPYVTARADGVSEILTDGENCLMIDPADPADLAAKIKTLRDDPAQAARLAAAGLALYRKRFAPEKAVMPILGLLDRLASGRPS